MSQLCIGTANFGTKYGLDNTKINDIDLFEIIRVANTWNVLTIDTSFEYSNSHDNLNKVINENMVVNSKIFLEQNSCFSTVKKKITDFNKSSPSKIYSLLLHNQNDAIQPEKITLMKKLKSEGVVDKIGASFYDLHVLKNALDIWTPDIVQVPINPFNLDFISGNFLKKLKRKNIKIFARSVFLQGLIVKEFNSIDIKLKKELVKWFNYCKSKSIHPVKGCLDFCKSINEIDFIIVGVQDAEDLKQIIEYYNQPIILNHQIILRKKYKKVDLRKI